MNEPRAESGILFLGPWSEELLKVALDRFGSVKVLEIGEPLVNLQVPDKRGGHEATDVLMRISAMAPESAVIGYFCDADSKTEGVRVFQGGRETERREESWESAEPQDPGAWPIGSLAMTFGLPVEAITAVPRPERPPLAQAIEAMLRGEEIEDAELRQQGLELVGQLPMEEATMVLARHLKHEDWVSRFHAARGYTSQDRGAGVNGRPRIESILQDEDEGVREAALQGLLSLIPEIGHSAKPLIEQIDASIELGLKDEDEDVREVAEQVAELRTRLLG